MWDDTRMVNDFLTPSPAHPPTRPVQALVAARAGWLGKGLKVLLESMPQIDGVHLLEDGECLLPELQALAPALVVLDLALFQTGAQQVLDTLNAAHPQVNRIVLVETARQEGALRARGETGVVLIGSAVQELAELILVKIQPTR